MGDTLPLQGPPASESGRRRAVPFGKSRKRPLQFPQSPSDARLRISRGGCSPRTHTHTGSGDRGIARHRERKDPEELDVPT